MNHYFSVEIATQLGIESAIIIQNLRHWIVKNKANGKHFYEGHTWTYNSVKAFGELFPYMTESCIRSVLNGLVKNGILITGTFSQNPYDKTRWYAFRDEKMLNSDEFAICENSHIDVSNSADGLSGNHTSITDNKPDNNQDIKPFEAKASFQKPLFSTTGANPSNVEAETDKEPRAKAGQKPKKQKEKAPVDPAYPKFVQIWTEAYPELGFDGLSGRKIKSLITQTKGILRENGKDPDFEPWNLFAYILAYMKREGHWVHGKSISTVDSKYREVYFEIKHGKQKPNIKVSARDILNSL